MERKDGWVSCQRCWQVADAAKASVDKAAADRSSDSELPRISLSGFRTPFAACMFSKDAKKAIPTIKTPAVGVPGTGLPDSSGWQERSNKLVAR